MCSPVERSPARHDACTHVLRFVIWWGAEILGRGFPAFGLEGILHMEVEQPQRQPRHSFTVHGRQPAVVHPSSTLASDICLGPRANPHSDLHCLLCDTPDHVQPNVGRCCIYDRDFRCALKQQRFVRILWALTSTLVFAKSTCCF
jgi:hypothetical protein